MYLDTITPAVFLQATMNLHQFFADISAEYACSHEKPNTEDQLNEVQPIRLLLGPFTTIGAKVYLNSQEWRAGLEK